MKALVLTGVKKFEIQNMPTPQIEPDEVLINTAYAGVCGTDHDLYAGRPGSAAAVPPIVLGHENSGVVAAVGSEVTNVKVGDRVAVDPNIYCGQCEFCLTQRPELCDHLSAVGVTRDGGLAEQFTAPATVVYKLPDNVSLRDAAAIEPVSCAVHGLDLLKLHPYHKALVIGDGFMGQIFAQLLQAYGVHQVDLAGIFDEKLQRNKELFGVTETYNTTREQIPADSYDVIVEAVGLPATQAQAVAAAKKGGPGADVRRRPAGGAFRNEYVRHLQEAADHPRLLHQPAHLPRCHLAGFRRQDEHRRPDQPRTGARRGAGLPRRQDQGRFQGRRQDRRVTPRAIRPHV